MGDMGMWGLSSYSPRPAYELITSKPLSAVRLDPRGNSPRPLVPIVKPGTALHPPEADVKVTKDMLDLAKHIVNQKAGHFEPDKFEDQYETALIDLINQKRAGKPITAKERPRGENVVDLMDALRKSIGGAEAAKDAKPAEKPRKVASGQKEMLLLIVGKKPAKEAAAKKPAAKSQRKSA
jgi:hypothetical protein